MTAACDANDAEATIGVLLSWIYSREGFVATGAGVINAHASYIVTLSPLALFSLLAERPDCTPLRPYMLATAAAI